MRGDGCNRAHHQNRRSHGARRPLPGSPRDLDATDEGLFEPEKLGNEACQASRQEESEGCACTQACRDLAPDVDRWNRIHGQKARQGGCSGRCLIGGIKSFRAGLSHQPLPKRSPVAGTMDRARLHITAWRSCDHAHLDWSARSSSDPIRWRPRADPVQKRESSGGMEATKGKEESKKARKQESKKERVERD